MRGKGGCADVSQSLCGFKPRRVPYRQSHAAWAWKGSDLVIKVAYYFYYYLSEV